MQHITLSIPSQAEAIDLVSTCLGSLCQAQTPFDASNISALQLALVEALNNVVEYACADDNENDIEVKLSFTGTSLEIEIFDYGKTMPANPLLENLQRVVEFDPSNLDTLSEGGRGLFIIQQCMDVFDYQAGDGFKPNRFYMCRYYENV